MFLLAVLIGIYSYIIFFLGIAGFLFKPYVLAVSLIYLVFIIFIFKSQIITSLKKIKKFSVLGEKFSLFLIFLLGVQVSVNFIGVLSPETAFDALWYHLTLPKIYILTHTISHIPGNLLYYSDMPKLTEMLYIPFLMFGNEILAKSVHFIFGILVLVALYKISRKYLSQSLSLLVLLVFYSNLVVGWETISAYIDLARTFFEVMALWGFLNWAKDKKTKSLVLSGLMLGLSIASKVIAVESLLIFFALLVYLFISEKERFLTLIENAGIYLFSCLIIPLPWFIFSFINTGNPVYPFFSKNINTGTNFVFPDILKLPNDFLSLFIFSSDPISPLYLIAIPLLVLIYIKVKKEMKIIYLYSALALIIWYFTPKIGGGRFILPYLPAFSLISVYSIGFLKNKNMKGFLIAVILLIYLSSLGYRLAANARYIPVILGQESKADFLAKRLNFSFGDFYDTNGYFASHIKKSDKVLLYGFHNLYYVDFPFIDSSWIKKGDVFDYIAVQNTSLPPRFKSWNLIYYNPVTHVKLYSLGGERWRY